MLYLDHDFYSNFSSGISSGDNELISDIIINETSELIVYKTQKVIDLLNSVGVKTSEKATDEKIVDNILDNLSSNAKLCKGLAFLIAENNDASKVKAPLDNEKAKAREARITRSRGATIKQIDNIASGVMGIGDAFTYKPQLKKEFKLQLMRVIETKSQAVGERDRKHANNNGAKIIIWGLVFVAVGVGVYYLIKHNKKKKAADGMLVEGAEAAPVEPTPAVEPAPAVEPKPEYIQPDASIEAAAGVEAPQPAPAQV